MNVKDNRSFWVYLLLSIVTCGLYSIYFWYVYVEDLNTIFYGCLLYTSLPYSALL